MATKAKHDAAKNERAIAEPDEVRRVLSRPGISPDDLYRLQIIPLSRNGIYDACRRGDIDCFKSGKKIIITTAHLRRKLGLEGGA
jgi:hypothetical protein